MYTCLNGSPHQHSLAIEGRACYGLIKLPGSVAPTPSYLEARITPRQLKYIEDLGGDAMHAAKLSKSEASAYIDRLKKGAGSMTTTEPVKTKRDQQLDMLAELIKVIPDGYFATQIEEGERINFVRISRPKRNRYAGSIKVQTQHGPRFENAAALWPSGKWSVWDSRVIDFLLLLVVDFKGCALRYARTINKCCRCNAALTDERSRHYGIGPECEKHSPWVIEEVDALDAG